MTAGHKHRVVRIYADAHPLVRVGVRLLRVHLRTTTNTAQVRRARFVWGMLWPDEPDYPRKYDRSPAPSPAAYVLTPLGILHTLFGLTLEVEPDERGTG